MDGWEGCSACFKSEHTLLLSPSFGTESVGVAMCVVSVSFQTEMGAGGSTQRSQTKDCKEEEADSASQPPPSNTTPHPSPRRSFVTSFSEAMLIAGNGKRNSQRKFEICQHSYLERCQRGHEAEMTTEEGTKEAEEGERQGEAGEGKRCWRCLDCKSLVEDIERIEEEEKWQRRIAEEDKPMESSEERAKVSLNRGVTLQWLVEFTKQHDCWLLPTWLVRRNIILPATASSRCRYVDLPEVHQSGAVGRATTFVSHCWGAPWGSLVTAITSGSYDPNRRIWCDLFAVRQWEGSDTPNGDYQNVIKLCTSFILCCSPRPSHRLNSVDPLSGDAKKILSLYRTWCLIELHAAVSAKLEIVIRCGAYQRPSFLNSHHSFKPNITLLEKLVEIVDLSHSLTTLSEDHARLLKDAEECPGGVEGVNDVVKSAVKGTVLCGSLNENDNLYHAVCGDTVALNILKQDPGRSLVQAAARGYLSLVRELSADCGGASVNVEARYHDYTALMAAAAGGHVETVKYLLSMGSSVEAAHPLTGNTALFYAACHGFHLTADCLLLKGAAIDAQNSSLQTPLMLAAENGHTHTVTFLLTRGAQINHHDARGSTPLLLAAAGGHASTVKVLLSKGALKLVKNLDGYNAITIAEKNQFAECIALLTESAKPR